jgi:hypothetical protein
MEKRQLPKLADIMNGSIQSEIKLQNDLNIILNSEPNPAWLKDHPTVKIKKSGNNLVPLKFIPIGIIEYLMTRIFVEWKTEIMSYSLIANSCSVHVRVHYLDPVSGEWKWNDGLGAAPLQTNSGAGATDFMQLKNDAVVKALPAAESYAIKDACEKLGKIFGKDLGRAEEMVMNSDAYFSMGDRFIDKEFQANLNRLKIEASDALSTLSDDDSLEITALFNDKEESQMTPEDYSKIIELCAAKKGGAQ